MADLAFVNDARVMSKGQVTIPKNVRSVLGINSGDRVTFVVEGNEVRVVNSAVYALMKFQEQMKGEAGKAGLLRMMLLNGLHSLDVRRAPNKCE